MVKIGDRVVCVNPGKINSEHLKIKCSYLVLFVIDFHASGLDGVKIRIDNDTKIFYKMKRFILLKEQRRDKLKQLECSK